MQTSSEVSSYLPITLPPSVTFVTPFIAVPNAQTPIAGAEIHMKPPT